MGFPAVVTRQHDNVCNSGCVQLITRFRACGRTASATAIRPHTCRSLPTRMTVLPNCFLRLCLPSGFRRILAPLGHIAIGAEPERLPVEDTGKPLASQHLHVRRRCRCDTLVIGVTDDRACQRMHRPSFERRGADNEFGFGVAAKRNDLHTSGSPRVMVPVLSMAIALRCAATRARWPAHHDRARSQRHRTARNLHGFHDPTDQPDRPQPQSRHVGNVQKAGFRLRRVENVYLDVKIIEAVPGNGA
jgi:hypothetical protein